MTLTPAQWETLFNTVIGFVIALTTYLNVKSNRKTQASNTNTQTSNKEVVESHTELIRTIRQAYQAPTRQPMR